MGVDYNVGQVFFNSAIFQTLAILGMYTFIAEVLCLDKKQRKIFFVVFFMSMLPLNLLRFYIQYYVNDLPNKSAVMGVIMALITVIYISALKILTNLDYIYIFIADMCSQIVMGTTIGMPYVAIARLAGRTEKDFLHIPFGKKDIFLICVLIVVYTIILRLLGKFFRKKLSFFVKRPLKHRWILWTVVIVFNLMGTVTLTPVFYGKYDVILSSVLMAAFFVAVLYEIAWLVRRNREKQLKEENRVLNIENAVMKEYYNTLKYQIEMTRKFRHDIEKHMNVINDMIAQDGDNAEIENIAYKVNFDYGYLKNEYFCDNPILNSILINRNNECKKWNIRLDIDAEKFNNDKIKEIDLIALISNLFDNAIEECKSIAKENLDTQIKFKMKNESNNILITIDNSTTKKEILEKGVTTKSDKYAHGVGLEIVEEITKRYNGKMERKIQDNIYETHIILKTE